MNRNLFWILVVALAIVTAPKFMPLGGVLGSTEHQRIVKDCATTGTAKLGDYSITCAVERKP